VIASVYLSTVTGEELLTVQAHDLDPYVTVTIRQHSIDLACFPLSGLRNQ
jgi:hypothetical protein